MSLPTNASTANYVSYSDEQLIAMARAKHADDFNAFLGMVFLVALAVGAIAVLVLP